MQVLSLVRRVPPYPGVDLDRGIVAAGDELVTADRDAEALVTWNCYGRGERAVARLRARVPISGVHVVVENLVWPGWYYVGRDGWNGRGWWPAAANGATRSLPAPLLQWRPDGTHVLVVGQRGGTYSPLAMPATWPDDTIRKLLAWTDRPLRYRPHPGRVVLPGVVDPRLTISDPRTPFAADLAGAHAVVVWTSTAAVEAVLEGVPVLLDGPCSLARSVVGPLSEVNVNNPVRPTRGNWYDRLALVARRREELADGSAWRWVTGR